MAPLEVREHLIELRAGRRQIESEHALDDVVRTGLVGWIQVAWFYGRLELAHDNSGWIRAQMDILPAQKCVRWHGVLE